MNIRIAIVAVFVAVGAHPAAAQSLTPDTAQVALQVTDVTLDGRLTFGGRGFAPGESTTVAVEDDQGRVQGQLEPLNAESDGQVYRTSVPVPAGLAPGAHTLRITGVTSGRFGRATFDLRWQTPSVHLDVYAGKPAQTLAFTGTGFVPNEAVDVSLGDQPLTTINADVEGRILRATISIPSLSAGDYTVLFVGQTSRTPVAVGLNIQGFRPWVVLHNYYVPPQSGVGFSGEDFVPGEAVAVYLNSTLSAPVVQTTADSSGRIAAANAVSAANLTGDNQLIFVGQQSQAQLSVKFSVAAP
jgi:5-hydroxyisourate hydrolase-like protein (transthyretin family)